MIRLILTLVLVFTPDLTGQQDSVYRTVFTNRTTAGRSSVLPNIGQSQHVIYFVASNNGGTCIMNGDGLDLYLEASYDGTNYVPVSPKRVPAYNYVSGVSTPPYTGMVTANGVFPYIRIALAAVYAQCTYNVYYSGSRAPSPYPQSVTASSGGFSTVSVPSVTLGASPVALISPSAPGVAPTDSNKVMVYFLSVTAAGASTITFQYYPTAVGGVGNVCSGTPSANLLEVRVPASGSYIASGFMAPVLIGTPNFYLCGTSTNAVAYNITFRVE